MSKQEFSRLEVLLRVQSGRLRVNDACVLIGLQRRQVFRLLRGLKQDGAEASTDPALATTCRVRCRSPSCWHPVHSAGGRRGHFGAGRDRGRSEIPRLQVGELCLVQLCGGVRPRLGAMGMEHLVSARHMVGARMMVLRRHRRGCV